MTLLIFGLAVLIGVHVIPMLPTFRRGLLTVLGSATYRLLFALVSAAGLVLIVAGTAEAPRIPLWAPPAWGRYAPMVLMLPAMGLLVAAYLPSNVKRITPHPMLWAVILWSVSHLLANGDAASLLLFGSLGLYALFDIHSANRRGATPQQHGTAVRWDLMSVGAGLGLYALLVLNHGRLFGVPAVAAQ